MSEAFDDDGDDEGGWLISYADMMTLIACFFILMMAFANYDPVGFNEKAKELSKHFLKDKYKSSDTKLTKIQEEIASHPEIKKLTKVSVKDSELVISFSGSVLFEKGQQSLNQKTMLVVDALVDIIKQQDPNFRILVEGHTDGDEHLFRNSRVRNLTAWQLAATRATQIAARFEYFGFDPVNIVASSFGSTRPLVPNFDETSKPLLSNQGQNRRVEIKVLRPVKALKKFRMGLGVYFRDSVDEKPESDRFQDQNFERSTGDSEGQTSQ